MSAPAPRDGLPDLARAERLAVVQRIALGVHRYEIRVPGPDGRPGALLAWAQSRRLSAREEVRLWTGPDRRTPVVSVRARRRLDLGATYDVTDPAGRRLAQLRKDVPASLLRSTWHLWTDDVAAVARERDGRVAAMRRGWGLLPTLGVLPSPFLHHVDVTDTQTGAVIMTCERQRALRDHYLVTLPGGVLDGRVGAAVAVALDTLESR